MDSRSSQSGIRVIVSGVGAVTSLGGTAPTFWDGVKQGQVGFATLENVLLENVRVRIGAQVREFDARKRLGHWRRDKTILIADRYALLAAAAADEAIQHSQLNFSSCNAYRTACIIGSGAGGANTSETAGRDWFIHKKRAVHPFTLPRLIASSAAAHVGIEFGIKGPTFAVSSAGASGAHAIAIGRDLIRSGAIDVAIVGGADSLFTYASILAFQSLGLLSCNGCYPFARNRDGAVLAEGAGILVLESARHAAERGATPIAELRGVGMTSNATDMVRPDVAAMGAAMRHALEDAEIAPSDVNYLNAHGNGTILNDRAETGAIKEVFGRSCRDICVSSTKSMHGDAFGAAGAMEAVACIKAMEHAFVPPTVGLNATDPDCDLDYVPNTGRAKPISYTMSNTFGLGGLNTVLVFAHA